MEEILSKSINARRRGLAVVATTALVAGATFAGAGAAYAATPGLTAESQPNVTQGAANQPAGDLTYGFPNVFATNSTVEFRVDSDNCATQAGIDAAIEFADTPAVTITRDNAASTGRIPTYTTTLGSSSPACATAGIQDVVTVTLTQPNSGGLPADQFDINMSSIEYNVGIATPTGAVDVTATPTGITGAIADTDSNAKVVNTSVTFMPRLSAEPNTDNNPLGTATFKETSKGAFFPEGCTEVNLDLSGGNFTAGVTPTISVPTGYTVYKDAGCTTAGTPATDGSADYTFYVKAPAAASQPSNATVTVTGLKADTNGVETIYATPTVGGTAGDAMDVLNVVYQDRTGGDDRYATAAKIFNEAGFGSGNAVLSGGELFPDALSANFLATEHGTGTLLTRANSLSPAAKKALLDNGIDTVYITGGYTAVSKAVEDEVAGLHIGGSPIAPQIQVVRLGGADRYATNRKINTDSLSGTYDTAILAAGTAPYDSLAVGPIVYNQDYPLVLTNGTALNHGEEAQFQNAGVKNVVIVGGEAVVSKAVADQLKADGYNVFRIAGANRYATAAAIATWGSEGLDLNGDKDTSDLLEGSQGLTDWTTFITNGLGFADALSAGPLAGSWGSPLLLARDANTVGADLASYLGDKPVGTTSNGQQIGDLWALGLQAATTSSMMKEAAADIGPMPLP
jgi:putative cell wall-binding protein